MYSMIIETYPFAPRAVMAVITEEAKAEVMVVAKDTMAVEDTMAADPVILAVEVDPVITEAVILVKPEATMVAEEEAVPVMARTVTTVVVVVDTMAVEEDTTAAEEEDTMADTETPDLRHPVPYTSTSLNIHNLPTIPRHRIFR